MPAPVDLLLITHNRRAYVEKSLPALLADPADFRLHCWDNASTDGTAELLADQRDPRIAARHRHGENANQLEPSLWFLERARSDVLGKVDDDVLLPRGWIERLAPLVRAEPRFGMLGCWVFMPEDWDEALAAHNVVELGGARVFRCVTIQGQSFLARAEVLRRYADRAKVGLPVNRVRMSADGLVSGYPLPLLLAHNMDDPRSPHCLVGLDQPLGEAAALTARRQGFRSGREYAEWIAADARWRQRRPFASQLFWLRARQDHSPLGRLRWLALRRLEPRR
jgi:glycosyltransferase involved in cell wall biosynthesis